MRSTHIGIAFLSTNHLLAIALLQGHLSSSVSGMKGDSCIHPFTVALHALLHRIWTSAGLTAMGNSWKSIHSGKMTQRLEVIYEMIFCSQHMFGAHVTKAGYRCQLALLQQYFRAGCMQWMRWGEMMCIGWGRVFWDEITWGEMRGEEVRFLEMRGTTKDDIRWGRIWPDEVYVQLRWNQMRWGGMRSFRMRWGEMMWWSRWSEVRSGHLPSCTK